MKYKNKLKGCNTLLSMLFALGLSPLAHADQTFTVTTVDDEVDTNLSDLSCNTTSNQCSLRAAIEQSNAIADGITTINIPIEGVYLLDIPGEHEQDAASGDLDIKSRIVIVGAGSDVVAIDGNSHDRVFDVHPSANLTLNDLTIRNGLNQVPVVNPDLIEITPINLTDGGGGIKSIQATLTLNRVNVSNNTAGGVGGGIDIRGGNVTINASLISNNFVTGFGGGISNMNGLLEINDTTISGNNHVVQDIIFGGGIFNSGGVDSLKINRSTISDNSAYRDGGGIYHQVGELTIINSTISGNEAKRWGGGLFNANTVSFYAVDLVHVTITNNNSVGNITEITQGTQSFDPRGGGLYNRAQGNSRARLRLFNSLVAQNGENDKGGDCFNDLNDTNPQMPAILEKIGTITGDGTCVNSGETISPTPANLIELQPLASNGGPTQTHGLGGGSVAINQGLGVYCPNHDQRKYGPRGTASCDSGAFEFGATDFGEPLVTPALTFTTAPPVGSNLPPQAFNLLVVVPANGVVNAEATAIDLDGDTLQYLTLNPAPQKGTVTWASNGSFTYDPDDNESGVDTFGFGACDPSFACSKKATISVVINNAVVESSVIATIDPNEGDVSPVTVISESDLFATMSDPDFTYPLGAMFFDVNNVTPDAGVDTITVTLQLPLATVIDPDAVVRKMNKFGIWSTLSTVPSSTESSAVFNAVAKTVTLTLRDNDIFDLNSAAGVISDPVALGVSTATAAATTSTTTTTSTTSVAADDGGGGIAGFGWLSGLLLLSLWRRRSHLNLH